MRTIIKAKRPAGFTMIELGVVVVIIGILLTFVLAASAAGLESARVRGTQALITKLTVGLEERMEAILASPPSPNGAHQFMAAVPDPNPTNPPRLPWGLQSDQRAAVLARLDQIRAEFPDVFFIDPAVANGGPKGFYPFQFAGVAYNPAGGAVTLANYVLPLGNSVAPGYVPDPNYIPGSPINTATNPTGPGAAIGGPGTGINGASYAAAASLYKFIGYTPKGYDMIDNNGNGIVDEYLEGISDPSDNSGNNTEAAFKIDRFITNHRHKTARAEMLYALLVGGLGPFGNVFNAEDFKDGEVKDTDNDGVPEFVDGWGEPLQFYRWPFFHRSGLQKGNAPYNSPGETRQTNQLDQNGQLVSIAWWSTNNTASIGTPSDKAKYIQNFFGPLADPNWPAFPSWDRSGATARRAYMTKFLIVSGGPDRQVGIPRMSDFYVRDSSANVATLTQATNGLVTFSGNAPSFVAGESWAIHLDLSNLPAWAANNADYQDTDASGFNLDDIANQDIQNQAGGFR